MCAIYICDARRKTPLSYSTVPETDGKSCGHMPRGGPEGRPERFQGSPAERQYRLISESPPGAFPPRNQAMRPTAPPPELASGTDSCSRVLTLPRVHSPLSSALVVLSIKYYGNTDYSHRTAWYHTSTTDCAAPYLIPFRHFILHLGGRSRLSVRNSTYTVASRRGVRARKRTCWPSTAPLPTGSHGKKSPASRQRIVLTALCSQCSA